MATPSFDKRRTLIYIAIAFGYSYTIGLILWLGGGLQNTAVLFGGVSRNLVLLMLYMLGPALAHIFTRLITREGWQKTYLRPRFKRGWKFWLITWLGTPVLIAIGTLIYYLVFPQYYDPEMKTLISALTEKGISLDTIGIPLSTMLVLQVIQSIVLAPILNVIPILGEEFGWRAYLQPKLMTLGPRKALLYSNVLWGLWHAPVIAMGYNYGNFDMHYIGAPWTGILMMTLATIWLGVFFGWAAYKAESVWPAVIGHGSLNSIATVSLYLSKGSPLLLIGPTVVGLVGGMGFILVSIALLTIPRALDAPTRPIHDES